MRAREHALTLGLCAFALAFQSWQLHVFSQHEHEPRPQPCPVADVGGAPFQPPQAARAHFLA